FAWYFGFAIIIYIPLVLISIAGGMLGGFIGYPKAIGLDILLPAYFLGIVLGFRKRADVAVGEHGCHRTEERHRQEI
ncbi:hypothetical protein ACC695_40940, partial [Rhizobium ruizarguesonis]